MAQQDLEGVDFSTVRVDHIRLFSSALRLETRYGATDAPAEAMSFDRDVFCEHFPAAFIQADGEVQKVSRAVHEVSRHVSRMCDRMGLLDSSNRDANEGGSQASQATALVDRVARMGEAADAGKAAQSAPSRAAASQGAAVPPSSLPVRASSRDDVAGGAGAAPARTSQGHGQEHGGRAGNRSKGARG